MRMSHRKLLITLGAAALVAGCQSVETTQPGVVGVDRHQRMLVSSEQMNAGAAKAYADLLAQAKAKNALDTDAQQVQRVQAIVKRLIPATAVFRKDAPSWKWEAHVITTKDVNAFCMPGGKMAVYSGLIQQLNATDDELAAVMGHEISHALREHSREQASQQAAEGLVLGVLGAAAGVSATTQQLGQMVMNVTFDLPHSRTDEQEADRIGVELAARAGYDPRAAITLWEKMQKLGGGQPPQILSTHPSNASRIADLKVYSAKVLPLYQAKAGSSAAAGR
jgi:predicted Zn-dependent protease